MAVLAGCLYAAGQAVVPVDGDRVVMEVTDWVNVPQGDADRPFDAVRPVVDLSGAGRGGAFEIRDEYMGDSVYCESRPDSRREYVIDGESVRLLSTESYEIIIREAQPPVWQATAGSRSEMVRRALRHQREHFVGRGEMTQGVATRCDLILAPGDTLRDVTVHTVRTECRYSLPRLIDAPPVDAAVDSSRVMVEEIHSWYTRGLRYPVVQSWSSAVTDGGGRELYCQRSSAVISREYLDFLRDPQDVSPEGAEVNAGYDPSRLSVDTTGGTVDIRYVAGGDTEIEMVLADVQGHVFAACARRRVAAGEVYSFEVSRASLPPGEYVLYIYNGTESITEKLPLR